MKSMKLQIMRARMWNPKPHIAYTKDEPLSWWFWRLVPGYECSYERTCLGNYWDQFWSKLSKKV